MTKFTSYIFTFFMIVACNSNTILKKPKNLIPKDKMVKVLTDSYIARGAEGVNNINKKRNINYLSLIYKKHNIDSVTFNQSLRYYTANITLSEEILNEVKTTINNQLEDLKKLQDSIHNKSIDSLENAHKAALDLKITELKNKHHKELNTKIDSVKESQNELFKSKISLLEKQLKDSVKFTSNTSKNEFLNNINQKIAKLNKAKQDSIDKNIKNLKSNYEKLIDEKTKSLEKDHQDILEKKKRNLKHQL